MNRIFITTVSLTGAAMPLMFDSALKGLALLLIAGFGSLAMWRASASARHLVWLVAVVALLIVPLLSVVLPEWRVLPEWAAVEVAEDGKNETNGTDRTDAPLPRLVESATLPQTPASPEVHSSDSSQSFHTLPPLAAPPADPELPATTLPAPAAVAPPDQHPTANAWLVAVWVAGCAVLLLRLAAAHWLLRRAARRCEMVASGPLATAFHEAVRESGRRGPVRLLLDAQRTIPVVWGVFRPHLLLPAESQSWDANQLRSVLMHELAHIRRRDTTVQFLTQVACALHWFNPFVWLAAWRLHVERERACDDLVLASGVRPSEYAGHLLHVATKLSPARWTAACGLAMARKSSLEGRLLAVLSERLNRRGLTRTLTAAALLLSVAIAIPVAMLRAQGEKQAAAPASDDKNKKDAQDKAAPSGTKLDAGTEAQLDWGEAVNGLRAAVVIRGEPPAIYLAVQNVSAEAIRFADTTKTEKLRRLYLSDSERILMARGGDEPTQTDVQLQPREVAFLRMIPPIKDPGEKSLEPAVIEGIRKDSLQTWKAVLEIEKAPGEAWTGKLTTGETRAATGTAGPQPKTEAGRALFKHMQDHARLKGDIPGGLLSRLHDKVKEFIRNNSGDAGGGPYAKKMAPLEPRFAATGDWKPADVVALLDDIAAAHTIPLEMTMVYFAERKLQRGQPLPAALAKANWGEPLPGGLRAAYLLEPRQEAYHLGTEVKVRILLHNSGKEPVTFFTSSFQQPGHKAKLGDDGADFKVESTYWTTLGSPEGYRLWPGEYCETNTPGLGIGARNKDRDDWANVRAGSWIHCGEGDDVSFHPGPVMLASDSSEIDSGPQWWLEFIAERVERESPVPADKKEREYLLYRVARDLFGTAPSVDEGNAFAADKSPDALGNLAVLLSKRDYITPVHGPISAGVTKFLVLPPDADAAKRLRVANNPGYYTLGDAVRLSVTRGPAGGRIVNEANIIYFPTGKDNVIHDLKVPDGYDTWAAGLAPGTTVLWIAQKGLLRKFDFTNPAKIEETRFEGDKTAGAPIPPDIREALRTALTVPDAPKQEPEPLEPAPAAAPATPAPTQESKQPKQGASTEPGEKAAGEKSGDAPAATADAPGSWQAFRDGKSTVVVLRPGGQEPVVIVAGRELGVSPGSTSRAGSVTMDVATSEKTITIRYAWPEDEPGFLDLKTGGYPVSRFDLSRGRVFFVHFEKLEFSADVFQVPAGVYRQPDPDSPVTLSEQTGVPAWYAASDVRALWECSRVLVPEGEYKNGQPLDAAAEKIVWGEVNDVGLRLGLGGLEPGASFPVGQQLPVKQYIRNDSTNTLTFSPTQIFNEGVGGELVRMADGKKFPHKKGYPWQGFFHRVRLAPGHYIALGSGPMSTVMAEKDGSSPGGMDMMAHGFTVLPGEYTLQLTHDIGQFQRRPVNTHFGDPRGAPGLGEWTGVLKSAAVPLRLVDEQVKTARAGGSEAFGNRYMIAFDKGVLKLRHYNGYPNMARVGGPWEDQSRDWKVPAADGDYVAAWAVGGKGLWVKDASGITHLIVKENLTETGRWTLDQDSGGLGGMPAGVRAALQLPPLAASQPFDFKKLPNAPGAAKISGDFFEMALSPGTVLKVPHKGGGFFIESGGSAYGPAEGNPVVELGLTELLRARLTETPNTAGLEVLRHMIADGRGAIRDCAFRLLADLKAPQAPFDYDAVFHAMIHASIEDEDGPGELSPEAGLGYTWFHNLFHTTRLEWERTRPLLVAGRYQPGEALGADPAIVWTPGSDGLSLGVSGLPTETNLEIGKSVPVVVYLRNDSTAPVKLSVPAEHNPVMQISLTDAAGKTHRAHYSFSAPLTGYSHHELAPGTGAKVAAFDLEAYATPEEADRAEHTEGKSHNPGLAVPAGPYELHLEYRNYQENPVPKGAASEWTGKVSAKPVSMKVTAAASGPDPNAAKAPRTAIGPGRYVLDNNVHLLVSQITEGDKRTNKAEIAFFSPDPKVASPHKPYEIELAADFAFVWEMGSRKLWVTDISEGQRIPVWLGKAKDLPGPKKVMVRAFDFTDPANVKLTHISTSENGGGWSWAKLIPQPFQAPVIQALGEQGKRLQDFVAGTDAPKNNQTGKPQLPKLPDEAYTKTGVHCQKFREEDAKRPGGELMGDKVEPESDGRGEGPLVPGLRVARNAEWKIGGEARVELVVRNASSSDVKFAQTPRSDNGLLVVAIDKDGKEYQTDIAQFRGRLAMNHLLLPPAHIVTVKSFTLRFDSEKKGVSEPGVAALNLPPGDYTLRCKWGDARPDVAREGEWTGELVFADHKFTLRSPVLPVIPRRTPAELKEAEQKAQELSKTLKQGAKLTLPMLQGVWKGADEKSDYMVRLAFGVPSPGKVKAEIEVPYPRTHMWKLANHPFGYVLTLEQDGDAVKFASCEEEGLPSHTVPTDDKRAGPVGGKFSAEDGGALVLVMPAYILKDKCDKAPDGTESWSVIREYTGRDVSIPLNPLTILDQASLEGSWEGEKDGVTVRARIAWNDGKPEMDWLSSRDGQVVKERMHLELWNDRDQASVQLEKDRHHPAPAGLYPGPEGTLRLTINKRTGSWQASVPEYPAVKDLVLTRSKHEDAPPGKPAGDAGQRRKVDWSKPPQLSFFEGKYDPELLARLAEKPEKLNEASEAGTKIWPLSEQILRAAVERDPQFRHLLADEKLKAQDAESRILTMSLAAYDYSVFGNKEALKIILDQLENGQHEAYLAAFPLGFVDEWDKSIPAIDRCFARADGAKGEQHSKFWIFREWLFPESFAANQKKRLAASKLDADSLRGVWKGHKDGVSVTLRFGENQGWEVQQGEKVLKSELSTLPSRSASVLDLVGPDSDGLIRKLVELNMMSREEKLVHRGTLRPGKDGTMTLYIRGLFGQVSTGYPRVNDLVLTKEAEQPKGADAVQRRQVDWSKFPSYDELANPFDPEEVTRLAAVPKRSTHDTRRLMFMILQAAAEKRTELKHLLKDEELKKKDDEYHSLALALAAYAYSVNGNKEALQFLSDELARQPRASDAQAVVPLGFIDEWDVTIAAFEKHFAQGADGAAALASMNFWEQRQYLYPESLTRFHKERVAAAKLDAESLRGVWKGSKDGVSVELRLGDNQGWEVRHGDKLIKVDLTTHAGAIGKAVTLMAPRASKGRVPCGQLSRGADGTLQLSVWPDTSETTPYPRVSGIVLEKQVGDATRKTGDATPPSGLSPAFTSDRTVKAEANTFRLSGNVRLRTDSLAVDADEMTVVPAGSGKKDAEKHNGIGTLTARGSVRVMFKDEAGKVTFAQGGAFDWNASTGEVVLKELTVLHAGEKLFTGTKPSSTIWFNLIRQEFRMGGLEMRVTSQTFTADQFPKTSSERIPDPSDAPRLQPDTLAQAGNDIAPLNKYARAHFERWQKYARENGDIPGGLIATLDRSITFTSDPKIKEWRKRLDGTRDWPAREAAAFLDEVAATGNWDDDEGVLAELEACDVSQSGKPLPAELALLAWGNAGESFQGARTSGDLRVAITLEPSSASYAQGTQLPVTVHYHNAGPAPLVFPLFIRTLDIAEARDEQGLSVFARWTSPSSGRSEDRSPNSRQSVRLEPGHWIAVSGALLTLAPGHYAETPDSHGIVMLTRPGSTVHLRWLACTATWAEVNGGQVPWKDVVAGSMGRFSPMPKSRADRESLIRRVTLGLTGQEATAADVAAFAADDSPDAITKLTARLQSLASPVRFAGWLRTGEQTFKVTPAPTEYRGTVMTATDSGMYEVDGPLIMRHSGDGGSFEFVPSLKTLHPPLVFAVKDAGNRKIPHGIVWRHGSRIVWVAEKDRVRKLDLTEPGKLTETELPAGLDSVPEDLRAELVKAFPGMEHVSDPERSIKTARFYEKKGNHTAAVIYYSEVMHDPASPHRDEAQKSIARLVAAKPALKEKVAHVITNKLDPATEAQLDWGEAVNGLRGAVVVRAGERQGIYMAVQNVSPAPLRFADTIAAEEIRKLYVSDSKGILFVLTNGEPTQTDVVLQPREVTYLSMMLARESGGEKSPTAALIEGLRKDSLQTWKAVMEIESAPEGAWKGKLTTGETRGAISVNGPQPKDAKAQALFKLWQSSARLNGDIPGGLLDRLHDKVKEFIRNNTGDASGDPYAKKMAPLASRFGAAGDWKPAEVVALMDDIAAVTSIPLEVTLEHIKRNTLQPGQPLPATYEKADWGEPLPCGLRMAYVLEPRAAEYHLGTELKARIVLHNSGKEPVAFVTSGFQQPGHSATLGDGGAKFTIDSTFWTTRGRPEAYRLAPGEYCEVYTPGLGIGARIKDREDWSNVRAGSWILCGEGNDVVFTPGPALLSHVDEQPDKDGWWLEFITERLRRETPVPQDTKEREYLLYRVVRELFSTAPSTTEGEAFAADKSPDALKNLAVLLTKHSYGKQCHGLIRAGETKFRVLPPDPDAAKKARVARNPGYYTLGDLVRLSVTRRPAGERIVNDGSIIYFPPGKDNVIHDLKLPDGYDTWAAVLAPGTTVLWVTQKGLLRKFDFTDPAKMVETRYEADKAATAPIPPDVREALRGALDVPDAPKQEQEPLRPAAPAPAPATPQQEPQKPKEGADAKVPGDGEIVFITRETQRQFPKLDAGDGVTMEIHRQVFHATDVHTTVRLRWPAKDGVVMGHDVDIASDAFANREQWAIAWVRGTKTLWHVNGGFDGRYTRLHCTTFDNLQNVVTDYDANYPGEPIDGLGVTPDLRAKFEQHFGITNPEIVDKSGGLPEVRGQFRAVAVPVQADGSIADKPGKPETSRRWEIRMVDAATGQPVPRVRATVFTQNADGSRSSQVTRFVDESTPLRPSLGGDEYAYVVCEDDTWTGGGPGILFGNFPFGAIPKGEHSVVRHINPALPVEVKVWRRERGATPESGNSEPAAETVESAAVAPQPAPSSDVDRAGVKPQRNHLWDDKHSAVAVQSDKDVNFVLIYSGFISTGLSDWTSSSAAETKWGFEGNVHLVDMEKTKAAGRNVDKRVIAVKYTSDAPDTLYLDGKSYGLHRPMAVTSNGAIGISGRTFILRDTGDPIQTDRTLPLRNQKDLKTIGQFAQLDLFAMEAYAESRRVQAMDGWILAWDVQNPMQHSDGQRSARLRIFPDGRVLSLPDGRKLKELKMPAAEIAELLRWLAGDRAVPEWKPLKVKVDGGELEMDPVTNGWDAHTDILKFQHNGKLHGLVVSVGPRNPGGEEFTEIRNRLWTAMNVAGPGND